MMNCGELFSIQISEEQQKLLVFEVEMHKYISKTFSPSISFVFIFNQKLCWST